MSGNSFGTLFVVTTFGESHGRALGCVVDGCPPGMPLEKPISRAISIAGGRASLVTRRNARNPTRCRFSPAYSKGKTTGTPIGLLIENVDQRSKDYGDIKDKFRPGHADYTYQQKVRHP